MPTPRTLALAIASSALIFVPSAFAETEKPQQVEVEFQIEASPQLTYENIKSEAWRVCKQDVSGVYASVRNRLRRNCQKKVVADVMEQMAQSNDLLLATKEAPDAQ
ncbi:MAG: UrcA family protein [Hyphomonas sp.]|nr:UrcA family protein [Hyphomonas sp.]